MAPVLVEGDFVVTALDPKGRVYVRVSRAVCASTDNTMTLETDFNCEEYAILVGDRLHVAIASTLDRQGRSERPVYDHSIFLRDSLMSDYEYVVHGKVYECTAEKNNAVSVLISFGGLLTQICGQPSALRDLHLNSDVYMLIRKIK